MDADVSDMGRAQGAVIGFAHPLNEDPANVSAHAGGYSGRICGGRGIGESRYLEVVGFNDYRSTAPVCIDAESGIPDSGRCGTDAMANFSSLRGPVGMDRVYARVPEGPVKIETFLEALKAGKTFATNGPLLEFSLGGQNVGEELKLDAVQGAIRFRASLRSIVRWIIGRLFAMGGWYGRSSEDAPAGEEYGAISMAESGWCLARASSEKAEYPVLDNYVYATTSPIYVTVAGQKPRSAEERWSILWSGWIA